ncbi:interferon-inducible GTPase 5-like isoform X2 [Mixophyes fleayi]|uniref:interferon-inducible GTPase 5-like isoform X2 n=1 Tax=Mixophyes fleayi TaxID=3061075 RepID=UPI003F4DFDE2
MQPESKVLKEKLNATEKMASDKNLQEEIKAGLEQGDLCKAIEAIRKSLENVENTHLTIAVTGETGAGKSTFINAIRGLEDDDEGAAETGVVKCTEKPMPYTHPNYKNVTFWDLPGVGTSKFQPKTYLQKVNFHQYDFFIIVASERFRLNNAELAKEIQAMGKKLYFVRSKIDADLYASQKRNKMTYNKERILKAIRENCIQNLCESGIKEPRVFLLCCLELDKYDFNLMKETLIKELSSNKKHVFLLNLHNVCMPILERKTEELKSPIWKLATLSGAVEAAVPNPGLSVACDINILVTVMKKYRKAFGLDQESLQNLANTFGIDDAVLKSVIKSPFVLQEINKDIVTSLVAKSAGTFMLASIVLSWIPVIGTVAAGGISFNAIYKMLQDFLEEMAEDVVRVLRKVLEIAV